jgi:hypothetical protein
MRTAKGVEGNEDELLATATWEWDSVTMDALPLIRAETERVVGSTVKVNW